MTCYSHNGKDLYCNKPAAGTCWTTGGWCPPDFGGDDEILPDEGVCSPPISNIITAPMAVLSVYSVCAYLCLFLCFFLFLCSCPCPCQCLCMCFCLVCVRARKLALVSVLFVVGYAWLRGGVLAVIPNSRESATSKVCGAISPLRLNDERLH